MFQHELRSKEVTQSIDTNPKLAFLPHSYWETVIAYREIQNIIETNLELKVQRNNQGNGKGFFLTETHYAFFSISQYIRLYKTVFS